MGMDDKSLAPSLAIRNTQDFLQHFHNREADRSAVHRGRGFVDMAVHKFVGFAYILGGR